MIAVKKNNDILRYIASGVFFLLAILSLTRGWIRYDGLDAVAYALVGVSFLMKKPKLTTIGAGTLLLWLVLSYLISGTLSSFIRNGEYSIMLWYVLGLAADILFIILTVNGKKSMGYAAAGVSAVRYLISIIFMHDSFSLRTILWLAGLILAGLVCEAAVPKRRAAAPKAAQSSVAGTIERMEKLQGLLEKGVITQEEFDAKKKQLLGL